MFIFFVIGFVVLDLIISYVLQWQFHDDDATFSHKLIFTTIVGLICLVGLPSLALTLCVRGVLPGTRRD
jgi:low temperature requirement protein LtrA